MTKLYFTDPIKALYMMREFGVKIEQWKFIAADHEPKLDDVWQQHIIQELHDYNVKTYIEDFFYVAKESEHIFEPKKGDRGIVNNELVEYKNYGWNIMSSAKLDIKIIMRDGKHFFNAENETN